ncbi:hypothetical protein [Niveispirillum sp. SYP-B3756]|uniref:hypothetical protein n=1 Tax=Niveispirillum sp. SYP-B3756 TaxID=2662178 RepID=UPI00129122DA|nr:hypothetical protein [Niveispirillum sp. SYP-B3756]
MPYEENMSVQYDESTKSVTVHFRGEKQVLPGRYESQEAGKRAGEAYCRRQGWVG